jgi:hypothetical protein
MSRLSDVRRLLATCSAMFLATTAQGQAPFVISPVQNLTFGFLIPGVPTVVDPLLLARSGQIRVQASIGAIFRISYTLPITMTRSGGGASFPLVFGASSAGAAASSTPTALIRFNPSVPTNFQFVTTDRATFFLGGEARPNAGQLTGAYTAPIIVTITNLGV